ncbi:MAG: hypothetical protein A3H57_00405 [Candidatus Taylorbacteria bacterium RIFCSPLOWO2_02_FULL_43_11]|uniref:EamA domain-containing protein n=1 Tax=Candidatus Taylorbacteria bacterium RIFCSPHIGHO2_02_FULL_43_32b TaxID=1802306 RepID=A0A1G2MEH3_9BACT|nr:MAG: hypothetical protein A2743_04310 [Candidatus Taylorbacteria bacterium RIFCSPHIGHO2_01_FULL_43_47]OHA22288.1 MAG: hypothetical protein A3C72_04285 [Candidatus Taylorbacteria bacterium RIFCSPHIGHO2_02_FULL_43_32b]OHA29331.1 MAG: hypothetical protein A3B08_04170 [Candidatus Taylorbacteria bacterium RIFCSPLOWO2_01_FULL_43_44]OHA36455.1 MAG: hypothetical protein A3H57_00405 [Candidatus Taylorbacteria bacterium RIFCSPLOWO2_02_FULL_43_11]
MTVSVGIGLAFVSMLCWGVGDFLIQRSTRKVGDFETLFIICAFGSFILFPFVWRDIVPFVAGDFSNVLILFGASVILLIAALLDFEALKRGKLAVVEPIWSFEIPAAAILAFFVVGEMVSLSQGILIALLIFGLVMVSVKEKYSVSKFFMEKGVLIAFFAALIMGSANFFFGWGGKGN